MDMKKIMLIMGIMLLMVMLNACNKSITESSSTESSSTVSMQEESTDMGPLTYIPEGCTYTIAETNIVLLEGEKFPDAPGKGDVYKTKDYTYTYYREQMSILDEIKEPLEKWNVEVIDNRLTEYEPIMTYICNEPVVSMYKTFKGCSKMKTAPKIPSTVRDLRQTFYECRDLAVAPAIPDGVTDLEFTFYLCIAITEMPKIPDSVVNMNNTFDTCLHLTEVSGLPDSVISMRDTFAFCRRLEKVDKLPSGVIDMKGTFASCENLKTVPYIPGTVENMELTFMSCTSLTGEIVIDANPSKYPECFDGVDFAKQKLVLSGKSEMLEELKLTASRTEN